MAIPAIAGIGALGSTVGASTVGTSTIGSATSSATAGAATAGAQGPSSFANFATNAIDSLQQVQSASDAQAVAAATGQGNPADVMIAATQASLQTELTVAVRDKAVDAFNQIMGMQF